MIDFEKFRGAFHRACPNGTLRVANEDLTCTEVYSEIVLATQKPNQSGKEKIQLAALVVNVLGLK